MCESDGRGAGDLRKDPPKILPAVAPCREAGRGRGLRRHQVPSGHLGARGREVLLGDSPRDTCDPGVPHQEIPAPEEPPGPASLKPPAVLELIQLGMGLTPKLSLSRYWMHFRQKFKNKSNSNNNKIDFVVIRGCFPRAIFNLGATH